MANNKIGFIGCGSMGSALVRAIRKQGNAYSIGISSLHFERAETLAKETKSQAFRSNKELVNFAKYIFLAVKPNVLPSILKEIKSVLDGDCVLISMAAGFNLNKMQSLLGIQNIPLVRIMPNTPVQIGEGMTALCHSENISKDNLDTIIKILECSGRVEIVSESLFDAVTAVSGSGPAYAFVFIEALADAAVRCGLSRKQAYLYASQTLRGAASMVLQSGNSPAQLKDAVCSPGGTTIEALAALENGGFRASVYDAVQAAFEKSRKISSAN